MAQELQPLKKASGFFPNLVIQPLYEGAIRAGKERGGNAAGIDSDGPLSGMCKTNISRCRCKPDPMLNFLQLPY